MELDGILVYAHLADKVNKFPDVLVTGNVGIRDYDRLVLAEVDSTELFYVPPFVFPHETRAGKHVMWVARNVCLDDTTLTDLQRKNSPYANEQEADDSQTQRVFKLTPGAAVRCLGGALQATPGSIIKTSLVELSVDVGDRLRLIIIVVRQNIERLRRSDCACADYQHRC